MTLKSGIAALGLLGAALLAACGGSNDGNTATGGTSGGTGSPASSGGDTGAAVAEPTDATLNGIVKLHNDVRAQVGVAPLGWSSTVASVAKAYADQCNWGHNPARNGYGENIFATSGQSSPADAVGSWAGEKPNYDPASGACSGGECGHYTQVVWSATTAVGCAKTTCTKNSPFGGGSWDYWVCDYDPPGNFTGQKAY